MKKKKKNRKLLFQMSVIVLPIFVAMIIAVIYSVYDNTVKSFLEAQDPYMEYLLDRTYENSLGEKCRCCAQACQQRRGTSAVRIYC